MRRIPLCCLVLAAHAVAQPITLSLAADLGVSFTPFVVTLMMNIFGTGMVSNFAFAMNIGVVVGVYSSVFVASPVALAIHNKWYAGRGGR